MLGSFATLHGSAGAASGTYRDDAEEAKSQAQPFR